MSLPNAGVVTYDAVNNVWMVTTPFANSQTGLTAAVPLTTLYTPNVDGCALLSIYAIVTRAASSSSTLGKFTLSYTDRDTGAVVSVDVLLQDLSGAWSNVGAAANVVGTFLSGSFIINAKAGTDVRFQMAYASSGATKMQYTIRVSAAIVAG